MDDDTVEIPTPYFDETMIFHASESGVVTHVKEPSGEVRVKTIPLYVYNEQRRREREARGLSPLPSDPKDDSDEDYDDDYYPMTMKRKRNKRSSQPMEPARIRRRTDHISIIIDCACHK